MMMLLWHHHAKKNEQSDFSYYFIILSFKYMLLFEDYLEPLDFLFHIPHAEQVTVLSYHSMKQTST